MTLDITWGLGTYLGSILMVASLTRKVTLLNVPCNVGGGSTFHESPLSDRSCALNLTTPVLLKRDTFSLQVLLDPNFGSPFVVIEFQTKIGFF